MLRFHRSGMAVRAHQPYPILRTVIGDHATPYRPETMVREPRVNFEDIGIWRRHPVEDRHFFSHQLRPVDRAFQVLHRISRSSKNSDAGSTPVTNRKSRALVQATYKRCRSVFITSTRSDSSLVCIRCNQSSYSSLCHP